MKRELSSGSIADTQTRNLILIEDNADVDDYDNAMSCFDKIIYSQIPLFLASKGVLRIIFQMHVSRWFQRLEHLWISEMFDWVF